MIRIENKQILINGTPTIIIAGEIHYFRLDKTDWQDRIDKLKAAGCNGVSSYIPWICHEFQEGFIDLEGKTRPELDLAGFIDLCAANDLYFFARPGPFIMAEMKNEGLPYWIYEKHPEIVPVTWDGKKVPTKTVDYLAPSFLKEVQKWYKAVMGVIKPRLITNGGNIIALQLDNEIGMLSWVSNSPDLTDNVLLDFSQWLQKQYSKDILAERYSVDLDDLEALQECFHSPKEEYAAQFAKDLGYYMRNRFARYVKTLRGYAEEFGVQNIPFVINIHGTGGGRGLTYPIGISQLYEAYTQERGYISGADYYLGDLTMLNFQDLYLCNAFMDGVNLPDQPLTAVEFSCGDGNYGNNFSGRHHPSAADFTTRMCIAQGHRLLNCYLFCGGVNYRFPEALGDGNDRISFTGERHGFAAPVSPEGELNYTYPRMARVFRTIMGVSTKLAAMEEERDNLAFGFIPDYFMTESLYPKSERVKEIFSSLEANRAYSAWESLARALLLAGLRFGAFDVQNKPLLPEETPVLVLPSASYMGRELQEKLAQYVISGGGLLLYGEIPQFDMEGLECEVLANALDIQVISVHKEKPHYYPSVEAHGWAAPRPEVRTHFVQTFEPGGGEVLLKVYDTQKACAVDKKVGKGRVVVITTPYVCDIPFFVQAVEKLGARRRLYHDYPHHGIFMTSTINTEGERFIHILNLDGFRKDFYVYEDGERLFGGKKLQLNAQDGVMLPVNMGFSKGVIEYSTAELVNIEERALQFRLTQEESTIVVETECSLTLNRPGKAERQGDRIAVTVPHPGGENPSLTITFH